MLKKCEKTTFVICVTGGMRPYLRGEPWRRGGESEIGEEGHERKADHAEDIAFEMLAVDEPEDERDEKQDDEMDFIEECARVVVPMEIVGIVERVLEPDGRQLAAKNKCVEL